MKRIRVTMTLEVSHESWTPARVWESLEMHAMMCMGKVLDGAAQEIPAGITDPAEGLSPETDLERDRR